MDGLFHSRNYSSIFSFRNKKNVRTESRAQKRVASYGNSSSRGEAIIVDRPFWPPINKRRASCAPPSTASCLRPTFTRFTSSPKPWPHAGFASSNESFWSAVGSEPPHRFPEVRKIANHQARTGGSHQVGKSAVAASLCRRSPKSLTKRCRRIDSGDDSQTTSLGVLQSL
jgi:hypothetical protein